MSHSKAIAEMILRRGIDVNRFDDKGYPGPFYLVDSVPTKVAIEILDLLVENGYKINSFSMNPPGMTILGYFLQGIQRDPVVIEWLLQHGADPTIKCANGKRPIDLTKKRDIINLLNKYIVWFF